MGFFAHPIFCFSIGQMSIFPLTLSYDTSHPLLQLEGVQKMHTEVVLGLPRGVSTLQGVS